MTSSLTGPSSNPTRTVGPQQPPPATGTRSIGPIIAASLVTGLVAALVLIAVPFTGTQENAVTGAALLAFALGWALLAVLSVRWSDQPQRWAFAPAGFMALAGGAVLLIGPDSVANRVLGWVWPPALLALVVWMIVQARRHLRSHTRRWLLYPVFAALIVASVGGGYESVQESLDAGAYPMAGQLVDVGGHRLYLQCTGSGSPTVVLEPGLGEISSQFGWIAPAVARNTRVCVYDRAGRGRSESAAGPQDGVQIATDLHTLLQRGHVPGPYVLAGHSFGGLYVLAFAARYPDQVAGLVLLDATAPASSMTLPTNAGSYNILGRFSTLLSAVARLGATRLVCQVSYGTLPPRSRDEERANCASARGARSTLDELAESPAAMTQAGAVTDLAGKPLIVVTAGSGHDSAWLSAQDALARLSTNSLHRVVPSATHPSLLMAEGDAAAASQAIRDVVASVRAGTPLAKP